MDLAFTDEQIALRDRVRAVLASQCTPDDVRASWDTPTGRSPQRWQAIADLGVLGVAVPQELGGMGLDETWLVLLLEEAGRAALPEPLGEVLAATGLIVEAAPESLRQEWVPRILSGEVIAVTALTPGQAVDDAHVADLLLVAEDGELHVVDPSTAQLTPASTLDRSRRRFTVSPRLTARSCLAHRADSALAKAADRRDLFESAYLLGTARKLADLTATHAGDGEQSGKPRLERTAASTEPAASAVHRAASSLATDGPARAEHVATARALAGQAAQLAARTALQVHDAVENTEEHDLHLWLRRAANTTAGVL